MFSNFQNRLNKAVAQSKVAVSQIQNQINQKVGSPNMEDGVSSSTSSSTTTTTTTVTNNSNNNNTLNSTTGSTTTPTNNIKSDDSNPNNNSNTFINSASNISAPLASLAGAATSSIRERINSSSESNFLGVIFGSPTKKLDQKDDSAGSVNLISTSSENGSPSKMSSSPAKEGLLIDLSPVKNVGNSGPAVLPIQKGSSDSAHASSSNFENIDFLGSSLNSSPPLGNNRGYEDLLKAFESMKRKTKAIEKVLANTTPIQSIKGKSDLEALESYLGNLKENSNINDGGDLTYSNSFMDEINSLKKQLKEQKELLALEAQTKRDIFESFQVKIQEKEEEINNLKRSVSQANSSSIPLPSSVPNSADDFKSTSEKETKYKEKLKELAEALKKSNELKIQATSRVQQLEQTQKKMQDEADAKMFQETKNSANRIAELEALVDSFRPQISNEATNAVDAFTRPRSSTENRETEAALVSRNNVLQSKLQSMEKSNESLKEKLENSEKTVEALTSKLVGLSDENTRILQDMAQQEASQYNSEQLQSECERLFKLTAEHTTTIRSHVQEKNVLSKKLQDLSAEKEFLLATQAARSAEQLSSMEKSMMAKDKQIQDLQETVDSLQNSNLETTSQFGSIQTDLHEKQAMLNEIEVKYKESKDLQETQLIELQELQKNNDALKTQIHIMNEAKANHGNQTQALEKKLSETLATLDKIQSECKSLSEEFNLLKNQVESKTNLLREIQVENDKLKEEHQQHAACKQEEMESLVLKLESTERNLDVLKNEHETLDKSYKELKDRISQNQNEENQTLQAKVDELADSMKDKQKELFEAQDRLDTQSRTVKSLASKLLPSEQIMEHGDDTIALIDAVISEFGKTKSGLNSLQEAVSKLKDELSQKDQEKVELQKGFVQVENEFKSLQLHIKSLQSAKEASDTYLGQITEERDRLKKKLDELAAKQNSATDELDSQLKEILASKEIIEKQFKDAQGKIDVLESQKESHEEKVDSLQSEIKETSERLSSLEEEKVKLEHKLQKSQEYSSKEVSELTSKLAEWTEKTTLLERMISEKEEQLQENLKNMGKLNKEKIDFEMQLESFRLTQEENSQSVHQDLSKLEKENDEFKQRISKLNEMVLSLEEEKKTTQDSVQSLIEQLDLKSQDVLRLESHVDELLEHQTTSDTNRVEMSKLQDAVERMRIKIDDLTHALEKAEKQRDEKDQVVNDITEKMNQIVIQLGDEEEKKNKSITLLKNSKNRILKLEGQVKEYEAQLETMKKDMDSITTEKSNHTTIVQSLQEEIKELRNQLGDKDFRVQELERIKSEFKEVTNQVHALEDQVQMKTVELESAQTMIFEQQGQLKVYPVKLQELQSARHLAHEELDTSKKLFQTKSIENDQLKQKVADMERKLYELEEMNVKKEKEMDYTTQELTRLKEEMKERLIANGLVDRELTDIKRALTEMEAKFEEKTIEVEQEKSSTESYRSQTISLQTEVEQQKIQLGELQLMIQDYEGFIENVKLNNETYLKEKEKELEDVKMRETQLKNLNKALKEEVRKLQKNPLLVTTNNASGNNNVREGPNSSRSRITSAQTKNVTTPLSTTTKGMVESTPTLSTTQLGNSPIASIPSPDRRRASTSTMNAPEPEYLKNVFMKFLESKDKRETLIHVLGMLLNFTPEEMKKAKKFI